MSTPCPTTTRFHSSAAAEVEATGFKPFRALADAPCAVTAHVVYTALDGSRPATTSRKVIDEVIRWQIGFDGVLLSDDLSMEALKGSLGEDRKSTRLNSSH